MTPCFVLLAAALGPISPAAALEEAAECRQAAAFIQCAREATERYKDQSAAILDGYRRIGRDFPAMGEHWINLGLLFDDKLDARQPEVLTYVKVSDVPLLLGVAYTLPLSHGELPPEWPAGRHAWHDHYRTVEDETVLPHHQLADHAKHTARLAMLHAWIWVENPAGVFADDNWAIPYIRLGIQPPENASAAAAKALSLVTGGMLYFTLCIEAVATPSPSEEAGIQAAMARSRAAVEALLSVRSGSKLRADDLDRLSQVWSELWQAIDAAVSPETRERIQSLSTR